MPINRTAAASISSDLNSAYICDKTKTKSKQNQNLTANPKIKT